MALIAVIVIKGHTNRIWLDSISLLMKRILWNEPGRFVLRIMSNSLWSPNKLWVLLTTNIQHSKEATFQMVQTHCHACKHNYFSRIVALQSHPSESNANYYVDYKVGSLRSCEALDWAVCWMLINKQFHGPSSLATQSLCNYLNALI